MRGRNFPNHYCYYTYFTVQFDHCLWIAAHNRPSSAHSHSFEPPHSPLSCWTTHSHWIEKLRKWKWTNLNSVPCCYAMLRRCRIRYGAAQCMHASLRSFPPPYSRLFALDFDIIWALSSHTFDFNFAHLALLTLTWSFLYKCSAHNCNRKCTHAASTCESWALTRPESSNRDHLTMFIGWH